MPLSRFLPKPAQPKGERDFELYACKDHENFFSFHQGPKKKGAGGGGRGGFGARGGGRGGSNFNGRGGGKLTIELSLTLQKKKMFRRRYKHCLLSRI